MPELKGKNHYLLGVKAKGSAKDKITGCYLMQDIEIQKKNKPNNLKKNKNFEKEELGFLKIDTSQSNRYIICAR